MAMRSLPLLIDDSDPRPIYVQIMDEIRRAIVLGSLPPRAALPSVRQLAAELRVNPNTVQQAYRELERAGIVYVQRGQGTYVAEGAASRRERARLLKAVAERALRDANRHGFTASELIEGLREEESR
jgi:GntR family transcriptional regulator